MKVAERKQKCVIGEFCKEHQFVHGSEAEELRSGLEKLLADGDAEHPCYIQQLLDDIDARDSLAFRETGAKTPGRRMNPLQRIPPGYELRQMLVLVKRDA